ncbi:hypothetical protein [Dysgonomonas sp. GY617]|uniref:hypothetical protein n=1 Tax=Dysgonomonas sp. GY617 TaxID=2780420 RepID=UPI00188369C0|nr:hypothetical protein [Dysgonomonas sp. GY617]MBF0578123.1 hypothetical protein [Dysgonomonas sp. GY617]
MAPLSITETNRINVSGFGRSDGEIAIKVAGGTMNTSAPYYDIIWKNSSGTVITSTDAFDAYGVFTSKIQNQPKGTYSQKGLIVMLAFGLNLKQMYSSIIVRR